MRLIVVRYLALAVPLAALGLAARWSRPDRRTRGAALLGFVAATVGIAALNVVAARVGWWTFSAVDGTLLGTPADLWLGWAALWGALPVLLRTRGPGGVRVPVVVLLAGWLWLDVVGMPAMAPLLRLGPHWLVGEGAGLLLVALPVTLLCRWTADRRHLRARVALQVVAVVGLTQWLTPTTAISLGDGSWHHLLAMPRWELSLVLQLAALAGLPGLLAAREFVERGGGTPYPWDPPERLVTTGPYAYVANPMQLSVVTLLAITGIATRSWAVLGAAVAAAAFSAAVARPHEHGDLTSRHGAAWSEYRAQVRAWRPRWRPYLRAPARLHLASTCDVCSSTATALHRLRPAGLAIDPAGAHRQALRRARYEAADGYQVEGVAAVARALEHIHLGWALVGWALRVPGLATAIQLVVDGVGGGPRDLAPVRRSGPWATHGRS